MNKILSYSWLGMYVLCAALGMIQEATGATKVALMIIAVLFFLPPALLLYNGITGNRPDIVKRIRVISIISLLSTLVLLIVFLGISMLYAAGTLPPISVNVSFFLLLIVSSPLFCGQYLYVSLFLWACLLFATIIKFPGQKAGKK